MLAGLGQRQPQSQPQLLVPVAAVAQILSPQQPERMPTPQPQPRLREAAAAWQRPAPAQPPVPALAPAPLANTPAPSHLAPAASASPTPTAAPAGIQPGTPPLSGSAQAAPPARVELPSSSADYLNNPKPVYPPASKRMGEQGLVVVRVLIGADGQAQRAELRQSSGFERLDQAALATTLKWRYVPGKRAGQPEAMWFNVPINFVLE